MTRIKAAMMRSPGGPLTIEEVDLADPGPYEVVVRVAAAGVCHSDLLFLDGSYPHPTPAVLGHESSGIVESVGEMVTRVKEGDRVVTSLTAFCGTCFYCASGQTHLCDDKEETRRNPDEPSRLSQDRAVVHQFLDLSSFAERMLVHESTVVTVPAAIPLDRAALLGCGVSTGLGAVFNTAGVERGDSVAILGCGGVGLGAVQGARIAGASPIIAIDTVREKLDLARSLGATDVVDASAEDIVSAVRELSAGSGVQHAIEAIGNARTAEQAFRMLRRGGTATVIGLIPGQILSLPTDLLFHERRVQGCVMGSNDFRVDIPRYMEMYLDGRLNLDDMVTRRLGIEDINEAFVDMRDGTAVRSVVTFY